MTHKPYNKSTMSPVPNAYPRNYRNDSGNDNDHNNDYNNDHDNDDDTHEQEDISPVVSHILEERFSFHKRRADRARQVSDIIGAYLADIECGRTLMLQGKRKEAARVLDAVYMHAVRMNDVEGQAAVLSVLPTVYLQQARFEDAKDAALRLSEILHAQVPRSARRLSVRRTPLLAVKGPPPSEPARPADRQHININNRNNNNNNNRQDPTKLYPYPMRLLPGRLPDKHQDIRRADTLAKNILDSLPALKEDRVSLPQEVDALRGAAMEQLETAAVHEGPIYVWEDAFLWFWRRWRPCWGRLDHRHFTIHYSASTTRPPHTDVPAPIIRGVQALPRNNNNNNNNNNSNNNTMYPLDLDLGWRQRLHLAADSEDACLAWTAAFRWAARRNAHVRSVEMEMELGRSNNNNNNNNDNNNNNSIIDNNDDSNSKDHPDQQHHHRHRRHRRKRRTETQRDKRLFLHTVEQKKPVLIELRYLLDMAERALSDLYPEEAGEAALGMEVEEGAAEEWWRMGTVSGLGMFRRHTSGGKP